MQKREIKGLDLNVYSKKLNNGLEVYIIPDKNVNNTYATYSTRYGGMHNDFIPNGEKEMISVSKGIAHFLEHKMFEQEDGSDVFNFFSERGSDANANTNFRKTTYLFSGPNAFYENLEFLLDYVEKPYFTDENVEKEKGIIIEEIEMYQDRPYSRIIDTCLYNTLIEHPMKYPVIGTKESVSNITKEELYKCYKTFYNPSNMFVVITGNVDPDKTLKVIEEHENLRDVEKEKKIRLKEYNEPDEVEKVKEIINMDVTIPKMAIAYKINIEKYEHLKKDGLFSFITNAFDLKVGATSLFGEKLRNDNLITDNIEVVSFNADKHFIVMLLVETKYIDKVEKLILEEIKELNINKEDFERRRKAIISNLIYMTDNIFKVNSTIVGEILSDNEIDYHPVDTIRNINLKEVNKVLNNLKLDNISICILNPEND